MRLRSTTRWSVATLGVLVLAIPVVLVWLRLGLDRAAALATILALVPITAGLYGWAYRSSRTASTPPAGQPARPAPTPHATAPAGNPSPPARPGFRFDAYVSHVDRDPDTTWVRDVLVPRLERARLRVALSGSGEPPGTPRVVGIEQGIVEAKRTIVVLSPRYLADGFAEFENVLAQTIGVEEGASRLIPIRLVDLGDVPLPGRLRMLTTLDMSRPALVEREFGRLLAALRAPLPT